MKTYTVSVARKLWQITLVEVEAADEDEAIELVGQRLEEDGDEYKDTLTWEEGDVEGAVEVEWADEVER